MKIRFNQSNPVRSPLSETFGRELFELDTNANLGLGAFSRPLTRLFMTASEAVGTAILLTPKGDVLIKPVNTGARQGWQVFERRTAKGRVVCVPNGSHGVSDGTSAARPGMSP